MKKVKAWIAAARLRTLPLSVSGIIVGGSLGNFYAQFHSPDVLHGICCPPVWKSSIFWLAILTTIGFQILSNFANDYGDGVKGTDAHREGEKRMVASGAISPKQMKIGMIITGIITLFIASLLIFQAFGNDNFLLSFVFFNLGIISIIAAVKYTVGESAYGYSGFGDLFVFMFFGILSVLGTYFLFTKTIHLDLLLPAASIGLFSTAVLNLNNMRDIENDAIVGKNTLVVKIGSKKAKNYHFVLLLFGMLAALAYTYLHFEETKQLLYTISFLPLLWNIRTVFQNKIPSKLDSQLKIVALSTFLFAILFGWLH
ncbi:MAG: 1,4-dihydroxy-2-naphthoate octaprenyltransferase [Flavobacteriaceae bacterium]|nr:1,4-dihydroxy-2-naphthoate octaprenyltransferase [Flavobacteriaceae bacterium]